MIFYSLEDRGGCFVKFKKPNTQKEKVDAVPREVFVSDPNTLSRLLGQSYQMKIKLLKTIAITTNMLKTLQLPISVQGNHTIDLNNETFLASDLNLYALFNVMPNKELTILNPHAGTKHTFELKAIYIAIMLSGNNVFKMQFPNTANLFLTTHTVLTISGNHNVASLHTVSLKSGMDRSYHAPGINILGNDNQLTLTNVLLKNQLFTCLFTSGKKNVIHIQDSHFIGKRSGIYLNTTSLLSTIVLSQSDICANSCLFIEGGNDHKITLNRSTLMGDDGITIRPVLDDNGQVIQNTGIGNELTLQNNSRIWSTHHSMEIYSHNNKILCKNTTLLGLVGLYIEESLNNTITFIQSRIGSKKNPSKVGIFLAKGSSAITLTKTTLVGLSGLLLYGVAKGHHITIEKGSHIVATKGFGIEARGHTSLTLTEDSKVISIEGILIKRDYNTVQIKDTVQIKSYDGLVIGDSDTPNHFNHITIEGEAMIESTLTEAIYFNALNSTLTITGSPTIKGSTVGLIIGPLVKKGEIQLSGGTFRGGLYAIEIDEANTELTLVDLLAPGCAYYYGRTGRKVEIIEGQKAIEGPLMIY